MGKYTNQPFTLIWYAGWTACKNHGGTLEGYEAQWYRKISWRDSFYEVSSLKMFLMTLHRILHVWLLFIDKKNCKSVIKKKKIS